MIYTDIHDCDKSGRRINRKLRFNLHSHRRCQSVNRTNNRETSPKEKRIDGKISNSAYCISNIIYLIGPFFTSLHFFLSYLVYPSLGYRENFSRSVSISKIASHFNCGTSHIYIFRTFPYSYVCSFVDSEDSMWSRRRRDWSKKEKNRKERSFISSYLLRTYIFRIWMLENQIKASVSFISFFILFCFPPHQQHMNLCVC